MHPAFHRSISFNALSFHIVIIEAGWLQHFVMLDRDLITVFLSIMTPDQLVARTTAIAEHTDPEQRFRLWKAYIEPFFDVTMPGSGLSSCFHAQIDVALVDQLIVGRCAASAQVFERSHLKACEDAHDHLLLQIFQHGSTEADCGRRRLAAGPGDVWILDMAEDLNATNSAFANHTLVLPRSLLDSGATPSLQHLRMIPQDLPIARLFAAYLQSLAESVSTMTQHEAEQIVPATAGIVTAVLNTKSGRQPDIDREHVNEAMFLVARRMIDQHLTDPGLSPQSIAEALGLSRAALYRLFATRGGVASYIRDQRLRRSVRDLFDPCKSHLRIYQIALKWGFSSESGYSRSFRRRFGMAPRDARIARSLAQSQSGLDVDQPDTVLERWLLELR